MSTDKRAPGVTATSIKVGISYNFFTDSVKQQIHTWHGDYEAMYKASFGADSAVAQDPLLSRLRAVKTQRVLILPNNLLFALSGTATAFLGPLVVGWFTTHFHSQRAGYTSLLLLLSSGFVLTLFVKEERATLAH